MCDFNGVTDLVVGVGVMIGRKHLGGVSLHY